MSKKEANFEELMKMTSNYMFNSEFRAFLDYVGPKWYVEAGHTGQNGDVTKVIRNRHGIPVCLQVESGDGQKDWISCFQVSFYEPWDNYIRGYDEYCDDYADMVALGEEAE